MASFALVTLQPDGYGHVGAFHDIKLLLYYSLRDLGHEVVLATNRFPAGCTAIVFGAHLVSESFDLELPSDCLLFNTEQLGLPDSSWSQRILHLAETHRIWDYSSINCQLMEAQVSGARVHRLRLGYHPELQRLESRTNSQSEFVFYGAITQLREEILARITLSDRLRVSAYFGMYGWQRDGLMARARAVLNIHSSELRILEWVRILPLLANAIPCIALVSPYTQADDDQLSYLLTAPESDPTPTLENHFGSVEQLHQHAKVAQERFLEQNDQLLFSQQTLDATFSGGFAPAPGPAEDPGWTTPAAQQEPDPHWYQHNYYWISDPRRISEFHQEEGQYRQYHPDANFRLRFRQPWRLKTETGSMPSKIGQSLRIAVVLHFHSEANIRLFFANFGCWLAPLADFYITSTNTVVSAAMMSLAHEYGIKNCQIHQRENRGRDIPSKYMEFNDRLTDYDLCFFSHGKSSSLAWFHDHNEILCGSPQRIGAILELFEGDPDLGLVFPDYLPTHFPLIGWGMMRRQVDALLRPHGWDTCNVTLLEFPAGGFFWARPKALAAIHQLNLREEQLPEEPLARDHTLLHAIERLPCLSCEKAGLRWEKIARDGSEPTTVPPLQMPVDMSHLQEPPREGQTSDSESPLTMPSTRLDPLSVETPEADCPAPDLKRWATELMQRQEPFALLHFHHYDALGYLPLVWQELLVAAATSGREVVITTNSGFDATALAFLQQHALMAVRRANRGRCIGGFRETAIFVHELRQAGVPIERLILLNDSILPIQSTSACLDNLKQLEALCGEPGQVLAGFTESFERGHHLQSYALVANAPLLSDMAWWLFWSSLTTDSDKHDLVGAGEVGLSTALASVGVRLRPLYPLLTRLLADQRSTDEIRLYPNLNIEHLNPTLYLDHTLRQLGWCFIKKMRLFDQPLGLLSLQSVFSSAPPDQQDRLRLDLHSLLEGRSIGEQG